MPLISDDAITITSIPMTDQSSTPTTPASGKSRIYTKSDGLYWVDDAGNVTGPMAASTGTVTSYPVDGRLTLETGVPVSTTDQTAKTTLYYAPYVGNQIALYNGSTWDRITFTELSVAVPATTTTMYDVYVYNNSGTATLELAAWTNDTTRATALVRQNGVLCKTGTLTRRYVGSFRTTGSSGQTEDSVTKRFVYNFYNRVGRKVVKADSTSHTYNSQTWRSYNNSTANRVEIVTGVAEGVISLLFKSRSRYSSTGASAGMIGIGVDSTSANSSDSSANPYFNLNTDHVAVCTADLVYTPSAGYHYYQMLESVEYGAGSVATYGDGGNTVIGMTGFTEM